MVKEEEAITYLYCEHSYVRSVRSSYMIQIVDYVDWNQDDAGQTGNRQETTKGMRSAHGRKDVEH